MRHSINEWQDFSIRKDIEKISRELHKTKNYEKPLIIEIIVATVTLLFDKYFDLSAESTLVQKIVFGWLSFIALCTLIYLFYIYIRDFFDTKSIIKKSKVNIRPYVDTFDNSICYYSLTASNFYEELRQLSLDTSGKEPKAAKKKESFFYIETHYYINKCISELNKMENVIINVFTDNSEEVICNSKIHFSRLKNLVDLLYEIRVDLYEMNGIESFPDTKALSEEYDKVMREFVDRINSFNAFKNKLVWIEK